MYLLRFFTIIVLGMLSLSLMAQEDIALINGSFEGIPTQGKNLLPGIPTRVPSGWYDCGRIYFPDESPPDIHPNNFWKVRQQPKDGKTYLGMVVRDNETWESVSQRLSSPLKAGTCYSFTIDLCHSDQYWSGTRRDHREQNYDTPTVLRIWAGSGYCNNDQLLAESIPIKHTDWKSYTFEIEPNATYRYITLEAFYKTPVLEPYIGHILLDNASSFVAYPCDEEAPLAVTEPTPKKVVPPHKRKKKPVKKVEEKPTVAATTTREPAVEKAPAPVIMKELDRTMLKQGQTIRLKNLYFAADSSTIQKESFAVLDEVYHFLKQNPDITIEIGGHTNGVKGITDAYCDALSFNRAQEVAAYLISKGISQERLEFKGYGKRDPVATNKTKSGRRLNQRVEIKILSIG